jgi:hypothetical protein
MAQTRRMGMQNSTAQLPKRRGLRPTFPMRSKLTYLKWRELLFDRERRGFRPTKTDTIRTSQATKTGIRRPALEPGMQWRVDPAPDIRRFFLHSSESRFFPDHETERIRD